MTESADSTPPPKAGDDGVAKAPLRLLPRRWPVRLGCALLALPILLLVLVNAFLAVAPSLLFSEQARTRVDWRQAWCWWPATIHFRDVAITGRGGAGSWRADLDAAVVEHDLGALFDRTFHVETLKASGARFEWTTRESDGSDVGPTADRRAGPNSGDAGGPAAPPPRRRSDRPPWQLKFDAIEVVDLTTVRVDRRVVDAAAAPGRVTGQVSIETRGGPVTIPRVAVGLGSALVVVDGEAEGAIHALEIDGAIDTFRPREHRGAAILEFVTARLDLRADSWGFDVVRHFLRDLPVDVRGDGLLDADVRVDRGHLVPGSTVRLEGEDLAVRYLDLVGTGEGRLDLEVVEGDAERKPEVRATLELDPFTGGSEGAPPHLRSGPDGLQLTVASPTLDLTDPAPDVRAELRLIGAEIPDFSAYQALLPPTLPLRLHGGRGRIDLEFSLDTVRDDASGSVSLRASDVAATYQEQRLGGDLRLDVQLVDGDPTGRRFRLTATRLDLDDVVAEGVSGGPWWARIEIPEGEAELGVPLDVDARLAAQMADSRPLVILTPSVTRVPFWERLLGIHPISVSGDIRFDSERWVFRDLSMRAGGSFRGEAQIELVDEAAAGVAMLKLGPVRVGIEIADGGDRAIKMRRVGRWFDERQAEWRSRFDSQGN